MRMAHRQVAMGNYPEGITKVTRAGVVWTGLVETDESKISPAFRKLPKTKPARVFVTSMADLFHADVPDRFIDATFDEMIARPHLTFQVLTKRIERVPRWYEARRHAMKWPDNVWMGATVEDQRRADERIPHLLRVPARTRFLSCEALLGPIDLGSAIGYTCAGGDG
jgi:protein gp37